MLQTIDEQTAACIAEERRLHGEAFLRVDAEGKVELVSRARLGCYEVPTVALEGPWTDLRRKGGQ